MTKQEIEDRLAKLEKSISWLEWATGKAASVYTDIALAYDAHVQQLADAKAEQAQLKHMLASLS